VKGLEMMEAWTGFYLAMWIIGIIVAICWIVLPFAVIGTKPLLRQLIAEQQRTNALLERGRVVETVVERRVP
jgi:ABC-type sulfate transport system permease component